MRLDMLAALQHWAAYGMMRLRRLIHKGSLLHYFLFGLEVLHGRSTVGSGSMLMI